MGTYTLDGDHRFNISDYQKQRPFSNTLPGIAGPLGIPMWVFYVNRGQAITSFGVENKDHPLMEFQPANKAYQLTPFTGFRTFIKILKNGESAIYEPFKAGGRDREQCMRIGLNELEIQEHHKRRGLQVEVRYFILAQERIAGLVRIVKISNLADESVNLEILDGLPVLIPYGVSNTELKEIGRTVEAWMEVVNQENKLPYFRLRSSLGDTAEVNPIRAGNFGLACVVTGDEFHQLNAIVNPETVFGPETSLSFPANFQDLSWSELKKLPQIAGGRTPCAFFGHAASLAANESVTIYSLYGHAGNLELLTQLAPQLISPVYLEHKRKVGNDLITELTRPIATSTGNPLFDAYCRQTFLDNVLRGGWPIHLGTAENPVTYDIYSRKHGDPERDYNAFYLAPEFFSQGNGNFRDINQNRRSEVWFDPRVDDANVRAFMSLIQADGYNPLVVKGSRFWIPPQARAAVLKLALEPELLTPFLNEPFTPGSLLKFLEQNEIKLHLPEMDFLNMALGVSEQYFDAEFGEGYWVDHWTYNLDLIESYLSIYPDRSESLLFGRDDLPFFDSPAFVQPRNQKMVLVGDQPRQYHAVVWDEEKASLIASRREHPNFMRSDHGYGPIYRTTVFNKLLLLAVIKFATLDPLGIGIEMEADRPGWCDALNGLPGLCGSSLPETFELDRLLTFLQMHLRENGTESFYLPVELVELMHATASSLKKYLASADQDNRDFRYWDAVAIARETYREKIRFGYKGTNETIANQALADYLYLFQQKVKAGISRALELNDGLPPTYLYYEIERYVRIHGPDGKPTLDEQKRPYVRAHSFRLRVLPLFLEGPMRMLKTLPNTSSARNIYHKIKQSGLFDQALKMYKANVSLEAQPLEIGRLRAFTPGWLENESIFLHMEYKYLLELLRAGLYAEFFDDFQNALVAFQDPARYGRSPLENSSFIVSSAHPDRNLHGAGFVARLTGATAEFLSMWTLMMAGPQPFYVQDDQLCLKFQPVLPGWLFDEGGKLSFTFLGQCQVTVHNPQRLDTFGEAVRIQSLTLSLENEKLHLEGDVVPSPYAEQVRAGQASRIEIFLTKQEI